MPRLNWDDAEDIALGLLEAHEGVDPLTVRFTDLHRWVILTISRATRQSPAKASSKRFRWPGTKSIRITNDPPS